MKAAVGTVSVHDGVVRDYPAACLTHSELRAQISVHDSKRLDLYSRNMADHHLITDLLPQCELVGKRGRGVTYCVRT